MNYFSKPLGSFFKVKAMRNSILKKIKLTIVGMEKIISFQKGDKWR